MHTLKTCLLGHDSCKFAFWVTRIRLRFVQICHLGQLNSLSICANLFFGSIQFACDLSKFAFRVTRIRLRVVQMCLSGHSNSLAICANLPFGSLEFAAICANLPLGSVEFACNLCKFAFWVTRIRLRFVQICLSGHSNSLAICANLPFGSIEFACDLCKFAFWVTRIRSRVQCASAYLTLPFYVS